MRVGIAGAGFIGRVHARAARRLDVEVAMLTRRPDRDAAAIAELGAQVVGSVDELVEGSDLVVVATPPDAHAEPTLRALAAGRSVLCEKPLAVSLAGVEALARAAGGWADRLRPAHVVRFDPAYAELRRAVAVGDLGRPISAEFVRRNQAPPAASWFRDDARSGGVVWDLSLHDVDIACWVLGDVGRVHAVRARGAGDASRILLEHLGGAVSLVVGEWVDAPVPFHAGFRVQGTAGSLVYSSVEPVPVAAYGADAAGWAEAMTAERGLLPYVEQLADAVLMARGEPGSARVALGDALRAAAVLDAAERSVRDGRWVDV